MLALLAVWASGAPAAAGSFAVSELEQYDTLDVCLAEVTSALDGLAAAYEVGERAASQRITVQYGVGPSEADAIVACNPVGTRFRAFAVVLDGAENAQAIHDALVGAFR